MYIESLSKAVLAILIIYKLHVVNVAFDSCMDSFTLK